MGFYMEDNKKIKVYVNDAYMKTALLDNKKPSVKVIRDTSSELSIFKKLSINIPVVGVNDLTELLADDIKPETIDTNSTFLFLRKDPFLAYLYLLKEGRAYASLKQDILFGSSFNTRLDALLSFLNEKEDTGIDIFAPLKNQLRRYSNYSNPFEKSSYAKGNIRNSMSSTIVEPGFINVNYGNIFYIKNGAPTRETKTLFSKVQFTSEELKNYPLPTTPEIVGLLYSGIGVDSVAQNHKISDWEIATFLVVSYAVLAPVYALAIIFSWFPDKTLGSFLSYLNTKVYDAAINSAGIIGLSRMLDSANIFKNFLAAKKIGRIDWVELDSIFDLVFRSANFSFNNRLTLSGKTYTISDSTVDNIIASSFKHYLMDKTDDNVATYLKKTPSVRDSSDWYTQIYKKLFTGSPADHIQTLPFDVPSLDLYETSNPPRFKITEYAMMLEPITPFIMTGDENTDLNNSWLATLLLRTNYAYFENISVRNIKEPKIFQDSNKLFLNYILNNDILMDQKTVDSKKVVEIVNFGTSCFSKVVEEVIQYVEDKTEGVTMDIERTLEAIQKIKTYIEGLDVSKISLTVDEKPYAPLAKVLLINYMNWLVNDEKTLDDISEIFLIEDTFLWEIYVATFYIRHSIYALGTATNLVIHNSVYRALTNDPTGGNGALKALVDYVDKYRDNTYAKMFGSYLVGNTSTIYDMMAGVTKKSHI